MTKQIKSTTDYDLFDFKPGNRPLTDRVKHLVERIKVRNQLADYPILCFQNGTDKLTVADGQHRLAAARALEFPIFYHVASGPLDIADISHANSLQKGWSLSDYLWSWSHRGKPDYKYLKEYCEGYHLSITYGGLILSGAAIHRGNAGVLGRY